MRLNVRRHRRLVVFSATAVALVLLVSLFQKTAPVVAVMNGTRAAAYAVGDGIGGLLERVFSSKSVLIQENTRLQQEVAALAESAASADQLKAENSSLKELIQYQERSGVQPVVARVLSRVSELSSEAVLVNRGSVDGVAVGDPVIAENGMYIGVLIRVHPYTSVVRLVTDTESKVGVRILNDERTIGIAEGQDGVLLNINFIPQSVLLQVSDLIVTSGLDPGTPSGLIVGTVTRVVSDEHNPFEQAFVEPLLDLRQLTVVGILHMETL